MQENNELLQEKNCLLQKNNNLLEGNNELSQNGGTLQEDINLLQDNNELSQKNKSLDVQKENTPLSSNPLTKCLTEEDVRQVSKVQVEIFSKTKHDCPQPRVLGILFLDISIKNRHDCPPTQGPWEWADALFLEENGSRLVVQDETIFELTVWQISTSTIISRLRADIL